MKTDLVTEPTITVFLQTVSLALGQLKQRLQQDYEQVYPDLREIIHLVLDDEEANAWELSLFPHLLLPDLVDCGNILITSGRAGCYAKRGDGARTAASSATVAHSAPRKRGWDKRCF